MKPLELSTALAVREYHQRRIDRFVSQRRLKWETNEDLEKSYNVCMELTDFIGDGLEPELPWNIAVLIGMRT